MKLRLFHLPPPMQSQRPRCHEAICLHRYLSPYRLHCPQCVSTTLCLFSSPQYAMQLSLPSLTMTTSSSLRWCVMMLQSSTAQTMIGLCLCKKLVFCYSAVWGDTVRLTLSQCPLLADKSSKSILLPMSTANPASMDEPGDLEGSSPASQPRALADKFQHVLSCFRPSKRT
jgi:hypothetical protein